MLVHASDGRARALAPAKVNLTLHVVRRRPDGFHDIDSLFVAVDLADELSFELIPDSASIELTCAWDLAGTLQPPALPTDDKNLIVRAARRLQEVSSVRRGVRIHVRKRIPAEAGLGGGSSDAAETLRALHVLWGFHQSEEELSTIAAELGSDVPFFLANFAAAHCTGRGEHVSPVDLPGGLPLVLARPQSGLSTAEVYARCQPNPETSDLRALLELIRDGRWEHAAHVLRNDLEPPATAISSEISSLLTTGRAADSIAAQLSGSGSASFFWCRSAAHAQRVQQQLLAQGCPWVVVTSTLPGPA